VTPDDQRADIDPHADAQGLADFVDDLVVEPVERHVDSARRAQGLPAAGGSASQGLHTDERPPVLGEPFALAILFQSIFDWS
jgi:hypothetical protein